ncbi:hypothetical protein GCM10010172_28860 [Paractinoplanes ferrugineus]|uniref:Uncharacterized protein n=1 Tax=Paractinoplanes ferrugineus TaxID=113564 RepID=A0A919IU22_9ACTN|nr:hypothetical protein [Actinoplanes ferrugineus]GIE08204.1 hypothetical protein Afe05nite_00440 [Actinoplanes ferrugineus]
MTVPSFAEVNRIGSAAVMRDLVRRADLPDDSQWWSAVISVGQAGLAGAESGEFDAEEWASVLVESLDAAARRPSVGLNGTVLRRTMACAAAMHYFGERAGDPVRDPELVFGHLAESLGGHPQAYLDRYRETLTWALTEFQRVRAGAGDRPRLASARAWLDSTRAALVTMCAEVRPRLPAEHAATDWCAALPRIETIREAAR